MTLLLENPLPIWAAGAVLAAACFIVASVRRTTGALVALGAVVVLTFALAWLEAVVVTPREEVELAVEQIMASIEANDEQAILSQIAPAADAIRTDVQRLMAMIEVRDAGASALRVDLRGEGESQAIARFRGRVDGLHRRSGQRLPYFDEVEITWTRHGEQWLVSDYTVMWRGNEINAVESARGNRPVRERSGQLPSSG